MNKEIQNKICEDYLNGMWAEEVAQKYSTSKTSVYRILKRHNIELKSSKFNLELEEKVCNTYLKEIEMKTENMFKMYSISGNTFSES